MSFGIADDSTCFDLLQVYCKSYSIQFCQGLIVLKLFWKNNVHMIFRASTNGFERTNYTCDDSLETQIIQNQILFNPYTY